MIKKTFYIFCLIGLFFGIVEASPLYVETTISNSINNINTNINSSVIHKEVILDVCGGYKFGNNIYNINYPKVERKIDIDLDFHSYEAVSISA